MDCVYDCQVFVIIYWGQSTRRFWIFFSWYLLYYILQILLYSLGLHSQSIISITLSRHRVECTRSGDENKTFYYFTIIIVVTPRQACFAYVLFVYFFLRRTHATYAFCMCTRRGPITREHHPSLPSVRLTSSSSLYVMNILTLLRYYYSMYIIYIHIKYKQHYSSSQTRITPPSISPS